MRKLFLGLCVGLYLCLPAKASTLDLKVGRLCGELGGCLQDFATIKRLAQDTSESLKHLEGSIPPSDSSDKEETQRTIVELEDRLDRCNKNVLESCAVDLTEARTIIDDKIQFLSNSEEEPLFPWNEEHKKTVLENVLRKVCTNNVSLTALKKIDGLFVFNTKCSGTDYVSRIKNRRFLPIGWKGANACLLGLTTHQAVLQGLLGLGVKRQFNLVLLMADSQNQLNQTADSWYSMLDDTLVHEFVHAERHTNPEFKRDSDEFLKYRYYALKEKLSKPKEDWEKKINETIQRVYQDPFMSEKEKVDAIKSSVMTNSPAYAEELRREKLPARSDDQGETGNVYKEKNGKWEIQGPEAVVSKEPVDKSKGTQIHLKFGYMGYRDGYALTDEEEYLAVSLTLYRYNRKAALEVFSKEELEWLASHWQYGFARE